MFAGDKRNDRGGEGRQSLSLLLDLNQVSNMHSLIRKGDREKEREGWVGSGAVYKACKFMAADG